MMRSSAVCFVAVCALVSAGAARAQKSTEGNGLNVVYEWKQMDFAYGSPAERQAAIDAGSFVPENVIPVGLERHGERLFITLPRWKTGVPASLAYVNLNDKSTASPLLHPYPSWGAHKLPESVDDDDASSNATSTTPPGIPNFGAMLEIVSPFRVRADRCDRLWVLDTGTANLLGDAPDRLAPTQLLVYDLRNDNLLRRVTLPAGQSRDDSFFANIAVEVPHATGSSDGCDDAFAYLGDLGAPGLVVYSWRSQESWRVQHHFFHPDPLAGAYNISGTTFEWDDGLFGLALDDRAAVSDAQRRLYFHALSSTMEFSVRTEVLRNRSRVGVDSLDAATFGEFRKHGSRGPRGQSGAAFMADGVLLYTMPNRNALSCWRPSDDEAHIDNATLGWLVESDATCVFPNDVKVDAEGTVWLLSDNLQRFTYDKINASVVNYRVLSGSLATAVAGTVCERRPDAQTTPTVTSSEAPGTSTTTEHDHSGHVQQQGHDHAGHDHAGHDHAGHDHGQHGHDVVERTRAARPPTKSDASVAVGRSTCAVIVSSVLLWLAAANL